MSIRRFALPLAAACWLAGCAGTPPAPDASAVIRQAEDALGSTEMRSLSVALRGTGGTFGQAYEPTQAWPGLNYSIVNRAMNFETGAFREEFARARSEPRGGGAVPPLGQGEQRQVSFTRDGLAWNTAGTAVVPVLLGVGAREHDLWLGTPHGALKGGRDQRGPGRGHSYRDTGAAAQAAIRSAGSAGSGHSEGDGKGP